MSNQDAPAPTMYDRFCAVERQVATLLASLHGLGSESSISQSMLDEIRSIFRVFRANGEPQPVPVGVNINLQIGDTTDLPTHWPYDGYVRRLDVPDILNAGCLEELKQRGDFGPVGLQIILRTLHSAIRGRIGATRFSHWTQGSGRRKLVRYNDLMELPEQWNATSLQTLVGTLTHAGIFAQEVADPRTGLVATSSTSRADMRARQWNTDSCMAGHIQRDSNPGGWVRSAITNAGSLIIPDNVRAALLSVWDPSWFRHGSVGDGISHIFLRDKKNCVDEGLVWDEENCVPLLSSIRRDAAWGNNKRLGSQAQLLLSLLETIKAGALTNAVWGFRWNAGPALDSNFPPFNTVMTEMQKNYVIKAIQVAAMYLLAVEWNGGCYDFAAPTASDWEEEAPQGGCASDTSWMVDAIGELCDLLFNRDYNDNPVMQDIRERLNNVSGIDHHEAGRALDALRDRPFADFRNRSCLDSFIDSGSRFLAKNVVNPVVNLSDGFSRPTPSGVRQFPARDTADTSLVFVAAYGRRFDLSNLRDARVRLGIVEYCADNLMPRETASTFGMKRYGSFTFSEQNVRFHVWDSYLGPEFEVGLIMPELIRPTIFGAVTYAFNIVRDALPTRRSLGTLTLRDEVILEAHERFSAIGHGAIYPHKDAHNGWAMRERQQLTVLPDFSAQWTLGPTAAIIALAKVKQTALEVLRDTTNRAERELALNLIDSANEALTRFINLVIAKIVKRTDAAGQPTLRADGTEYDQLYNLLEAFQLGFDCDGNPVFIPGNHTLPWSAAQLYHGLQLALKAARVEEEIFSQKAA